MPYSVTSGFSCEEVHLILFSHLCIKKKKKKLVVCHGLRALVVDQSFLNAGVGKSKTIVV